MSWETPAWLGSDGPRPPVLARPPHGDLAQQPRFSHVGEDLLEVLVLVMVRIDSTIMMSSSLRCTALLAGMRQHLVVLISSTDTRSRPRQRAGPGSFSLSNLSCGSEPAFNGPGPTLPPAELEYGQIGGAQKTAPVTMTSFGVTVVRLAPAPPSGCRPRSAPHRPCGGRHQACKRLRGSKGRGRPVREPRSMSRRAGSPCPKRLRPLKAGRGFGHLGCGFGSACRRAAPPRAGRLGARRRVGAPSCVASFEDSWHRVPRRRHTLRPLLLDHLASPQLELAVGHAFAVFMSYS